jgi:hypothetical protein
MQFTEYEGMILLESVHAARQGMQRWQERGIPFSRWAYERGANHVHAEMSALDREHVRQEIEIAAEFEAALRQAYPDRDFVLSHIPCYAVTFYQLLDDAPTETEVLKEVSSDPVWCQNCQKRRTWSALPNPDPEFPWLKWGACTVCGNDIVLGEIDVRRVIGTRGVSSPCVASDGTRENGDYTLLWSV